MQNTHDTIVIGGGVIGLSIGWLLQRSGHDVAIVEKGDPGGGASAVAAGHLR
jgi:glycine/D-amino acid oxidase-like deaminating enzyme